MLDAGAPLAPGRGGPVGALTREDVRGARAYLAVLARARGGGEAYLEAEAAEAKGGVGGGRAAEGVVGRDAYYGAGLVGGREGEGWEGVELEPGEGRGEMGGRARGRGDAAAEAGGAAERRVGRVGRLVRRLRGGTAAGGGRAGGVVGCVGIGRGGAGDGGVGGGVYGGGAGKDGDVVGDAEAARRAAAFAESGRAASANSLAAARADAIVHVLAARMTDDDAPFLARRGKASEALRVKRAAHRLMLGVLGFDGAQGLVGVMGKEGEGAEDEGAGAGAGGEGAGAGAEGEARYRVEEDAVLDEWYLCDEVLAAACKDYRRRFKVLGMLQAVARGLHDATRAVERAAAAAAEDGGGGGGEGAKSRPSRFWTDAREKTAQVSVQVARLLRHDPELPVVAAVRGGNGGGLTRAARLLHAPLPAVAGPVVEEVRGGLIDAREGALESLEGCEAGVREAALAAVEARQAKLRADCRLIDARWALVDRALDTVETHPPSLRVLFEVTQVIKAQLHEAGVR